MKLLERVAKLGRKRHEPERLTDEYPRLVQLLQGQRVAKGNPVFKPTPWNLRAFSNTPYARRAINAIKNPIAQLGWEVVPLEGVAESPELKRQCEAVTYCLSNPNREDSWRSLVEKVVTDMMLGGGAIEQRLGGDIARPLWLYPVDALSVQIYAMWDGNTRSPKYRQVPGYGMTGLNTQTGVDLLDNELIYLAPNPSTAQPFGVGPLEVAFTSVSRLLGAGEYAGNLATNARPNTVLNLGNVSGDDVIKFRQYWERDIEGQGKMPIAGGMPDLNAVKLTADGDGALYLKWQEFLKSEIATAFDLSPQNLGVERDVNRNTAEVAETRDRAAAIVPWAGLLASHINRDAIQGLLGFSQVEFRFTGMEPEDEDQTSIVFDRYYKANVLTPNEIRAKLGEPPSESQWGDLTYCDTQVALSAARGAAQVDDAALTKQPKPKEP